jgi:hypothetical protein
VPAIGAPRQEAELVSRLRRSTCLIATVLLAVPAAASAQSDGPAMPPAPEPKVACKASAAVVCGPTEPPALRPAVARYTRTLRSDRVRRGLVLPSLRRLFGRAGIRAEALADRRLARAPRSGRAAHAAGAAALVRVGSVGAVTVRASPAPGLGAGVDQVSYTDRISGPHGSQTRSLRFTAAADACPVAASRGDNVGKDVGRLLAAEHVVTVERSGRHELTTDFTIDTTGSREVWGLVNGNAALTDIEPNPKPTAHVRIRRVRRLRDLGTGRTYRERPLELSYELKMISPLWMDGGGFDRFIERYANAGDHDPADAIRSDRLLNSAAFEAAARTFMTAVEPKTRAVFERAQTQWRTPNRCVEARSDVPERLIPGSSLKVRVSATSKRGDPAQNLRAYAHYVPYRSAGLTVDPYAFVEPDANVAYDFTVTPPATAWPDDSPERLRIVLYSTGGIGEVDTDLRAQTLPIHYRVLSAAYRTHSSGAEPGGLCAALGGTSGSGTVSGTSAGVVQDIDDAHTIHGNVLEGPSLSGPLAGGIYAKSTMTLGEQLNGCKLDSSGHLQPCSVSSGPVTMPNPTTIGFEIQVPDPAAGVAAAHWLVVAGGVGSGTSQACNVSIPAQIPYAKTAQTFPLAKLLSTDPQTFTYSDSVHFDHDMNGHPASIDIDWTYSITVQRT